MDDNSRQAHSDRLDAGCFRLLQLETSNEPTWHLSVHSLEDCPPYVALSYAWNEPLAVTESTNGIDTHVEIDGRMTPVTPNLFHALHHLASQSHEEETTHFWIDALCINQTSPSERTAQVSIMHQIYRGATAVRVWLGPDLESEAHGVREVLRALLQKYSHEDDCANGGVELVRYEEDFLNGDDERALRDEGLPPLDSATWRKVVRFWDRGWFSRVWVQQEVALAREVSFWCGDVEFTQVELVECSRFFTFSGLSTTLMILRISEQEPARNTVSGRRVGGSAIRIPNLRTWVSAEGNLSEADDARESADRMTGPAVLDAEGEVAYPLLRLLAIELHLTFRDDCSDPRDRIFALLVLMKETAQTHGLEPLPLEIDYGKSVAEVFTETTAWFIEETGWLGLLSLIHPRRQLTGCSEGDAPSWVPDFSSPPPNPLLLFEPGMDELIASHAAMVTAATRPCFQDSCLLVSVKRIGVVQDIGNTVEDYLEHGTFEATARLLLNIPDAIWPDYTRVDYWTDVMTCSLTTTSPPSSDRRSQLRHWLTFAILRKMRQDYAAGRISRGREVLARSPSLEALARADLTGTLPKWEDWSTVYASVEEQAEVLNQRPRFTFPEIWGRRLFRLVELGFPHCPAATVLGVGPEGVMPGDEVLMVGGSVMPVVLRRRADVVQGPTPQARVVGEGFITGFEDIVERMEDVGYERVPFSVFPSSYKNEEKTSETTEVQTEERVTVQGAEREGRRDKYSSSSSQQQGPDRRDNRYAEEVHIKEDRYRPAAAAAAAGGKFRHEENVHITEEDRYRDTTRVETERQRYQQPYQRYADAQIEVEDRTYDKEYRARHTPGTQIDLDSRIDIAERDFRDRTVPFREEYRQSRAWQDKSTSPRDYPADGYAEREPVKFEEHITERTTVDAPERQHKRDMGYYDEDGHYHSFRHGLSRAADRILHPIHGGEHHHHHNRRHEGGEKIIEREETVEVRDREIPSAPRYSSESYETTERVARKPKMAGIPNTITIPCHHIRIGDLLILQGRPCQVIRITTSASTGQHRYLGVDLFTKQLHEESSFVSNPSPSVVVQNMLGPVFKQYRVLDIRDDGRVVAMTETGDVKQGLPVLDQSNLSGRLDHAFNNGRGSIRVLVINDEGRELAVDYKVVHGARL